MKSDYTHIVVVLDRSGSMESIRNETINGFNQFLMTQRETPGKATLTLVQFDNEYELNYSFQGIKQVPDLSIYSFRPRGWTALVDALGKTITNEGIALALMKEEDRPSKVVFVVITDGAENASRLWTLDSVKEAVKHQTEVYSWEFLFLGANIDAISTGAGFGIAHTNSFNYTANALSVGSTYATVSNAISSSRSTGQTVVDSFSSTAREDILNGTLNSTPAPAVVTTDSTSDNK